MKTLRIPMFLVAVLIVVAYLAGTLIAAGAPSHEGASTAAAITVPQWAAINGANTLLLGNDTEEQIYLPLILRS